MPETVELLPQIPQESTFESGTIPEYPKAAPKRSKFTYDDMWNVVKLVAKGCSEPEACKLLGFNYYSFANWKCKPKNKVKFDEAIHEAKALIIVTCVNGIEKAGLKDWRALRERLALLDRDRFSDRAPAQPVTVQVGIFANSDLDALGARVYSQPRQVQGKEQKQIQDKPSTQ